MTLVKNILDSARKRLAVLSREASLFDAVLRTMFQVRSTDFLMVGAVQACTRSSRLAAFGATRTISRFSARRSAVRCCENLQKRCHWRPPACVILSPSGRHSSAAPHCLQPEGNKRRRCLFQRSTRLMKNEKKNARTITTSGSPLIARRSDSVGVIVAELSWLDPSSSDP